MTEKTLTTENIKPALDALRGELAPWPVVAMKQDRLNTAQKSAVNSGITSSLVAQIIANTAAIRALESAITGTGLRALVVSSLPAVGTLGILYIVPVTTYDPETDADVVNYSNEYLWIVAPDAPVTEGYYEQVGQTGIVINNGQLTITVNGTSVGTFTANQSGDTTAAITVPTNADYVDRTTNQTIAGTKTFTSTIDGTASKAISDEDGTSIKTGYVNVAGNQTVTGDKSWTGSNTFNNILPNATNTYSLGSSSYQWSSVYAQTYYYNGKAWGLDKLNRWSKSQELRLPELEDYTLPSSEVTTDIFSWWGTSNFRGGFGHQYYTNGDEGCRFLISSKDANNNSYLSAFRFKLNRAGTDSYFYGTGSQNFHLGTPTNQWSSVYAQSYFYNGTAWGLDKANTWTNGQTYSTYNFGEMIWLKNTGLDFSVNGNTGLTDTYQHMIHWADKNNAIYSSVQSWTNSSENTLVLRSIYRTNANTLRDLSVRFTSTATNKLVYPETNADTELGISTNKWKTLNGINPGALSLPDIRNAVNIDITLWSNRAVNGVIGSFTTPIDCWVSIQMTRDVDWGTWCIIGSLRQSYRAVNNNGDYLIMITIPLAKGETVSIYTSEIQTTETAITFGIYKYFACFGNV